MRSQWITYKGRRILHADYSHFLNDLEDLKKEVTAVDDIVCRQPLDSVLCMVDVRGTIGSQEAVEFFKMSARRTQPHNKRTAVVGISGVRRILLDSVQRVSGQSMRVFSDLDRAKEWLIED